MVGVERGPPPDSRSADRHPCGREVLLDRTAPGFVRDDGMHEVTSQDKSGGGLSERPLRATECRRVEDGGDADCFDTPNAEAVHIGRHPPSI